MKIYRAVPNQPGFFTAVGHDGPRDQPQNLLNTFQTNIPVQAGDLLGLDTANGASGCTINMGFTSADTFVVKNAPPPLGDGQSGLFNPAGTGRLDVSAVFQPSNTVTVGSTAPNTKKGTATLNLTLPEPGRPDRIRKRRQRVLRRPGDDQQGRRRRCDTAVDQGDRQEAEDLEQEGQGDRQCFDHLHPDQRRPSHAGRRRQAAEEKEEDEVIGAPGFEPGTSPTRTVRATRLRHAPRGRRIERGTPRGAAADSVAAWPTTPS